MLSEFDLIKRFFIRDMPADPGIALGIGDDCALLASVPGVQTAISTDMLVEGRHFFAGADARELGHKALAVNLSDLAAMGATPLAFTLALALPDADPVWLAAFSEGMFALADCHACRLIGGDTTRGPLNICITVFGAVQAGAALRRDAASAGDDLWVSGTLGDARLALALRRDEFAPGAATWTAAQAEAAAVRLHRPTPRVALGIALRGVARAAIDVSDGLAGDLQHVLAASACGATIDVDMLPAGPALATQPVDTRRAWTLAGGDDYELCFTAPASARDAVVAAGLGAGTPLTRIGTIDAAPGLRFRDGAGDPIILSTASFDHFRTA